MRRTEDIETKRRSFDRVAEDEILEAIVGLIEVTEWRLHANLERLFHDGESGGNLVFRKLVIHRELNRVEIQIQQHGRPQIGLVI